MIGKIKGSKVLQNQNILQIQIYIHLFIKVVWILSRFV